jgi:hypothetical protein
MAGLDPQLVAGSTGVAFALVTIGHQLPSAYV